MSSAGNFKIDVGRPYPCWITVSYADKELCRFSHKEISDLHYAVQKAMQEAELRLGNERGEVRP